MHSFELSLPDLAVTSVSHRAHELVVEVKAATTPTVCPKCERGPLVGFGRSAHWVKDLPHKGHRVTLCLDTRRFRCKACGITFLERPAALHPERSMTARLVDWICTQSMRQTFASLATATGVVEGTIRNIFNEHVRVLESQAPPATPRWLGLEPVSVIKHRVLLTDLETSTVVDLLSDAEAPSLQTGLARLNNIRAVQGVTLGFSEKHRALLHQLLPWATLAVSKDQVLGQSFAALESVRTHAREPLSMVGRRALAHALVLPSKRHSALNSKELAKMETAWALSPLLKAAYFCNEALHQAYAAESKEAFQQALAAWSLSIPSQLTPYFGHLAQMLNAWEQEVVAYFDVPRAPLYHEHLRRLTPLLKGSGRGYSFEAIRAQLLYSLNAEKAPFAEHQRLSLSVLSDHLEKTANS